MVKKTLYRVFIDNNLFTGYKEYPIETHEAKQVQKGIAKGDWLVDGMFLNSLNAPLYNPIADQFTAYADSPENAQRLLEVGRSRFEGKRRTPNLKAQTKAMGDEIVGSIHR